MTDNRLLCKYCFIEQKDDNAVEYKNKRQEHLDRCPWVSHTAPGESYDTRAGACNDQRVSARGLN